MRERFVLVFCFVLFYKLYIWNEGGVEKLNLKLLI